MEATGKHYAFFKTLRLTSSRTLLLYTIPSRPASRNWIKANSYTNLPSKFTKPSLRFLLVAHHENPSAKEEGRFHEVAKIETSLPFKRSLNYPNTVENDLATILYGRHPCTS